MRSESIGGEAMPPAGMQWLLGYRCMEFPLTDWEKGGGMRTHDEQGNPLPSLEETVAEYDRTHPNISAHPYEVRDEDMQLLASIGKRIAEETRQQAAPQVMLVTLDGRCANCTGEVRLRACWLQNHTLAMMLRETLKPYHCTVCDCTGDVVNTQ